MRRTSITTATRALLAFLITLGCLASAPEAHAKKKKSKTGKPGYTLEAPVRSGADVAATEASILANIDNQKMIIELEDPASPEYAEMVVALADFYWDLSSIYFRKAESDALEEAIYEAEEAKDKKTLKRLRTKKDAYLKELRKYQLKTIAQYREVISRYPNSRKIDELRYYLGFHLSTMGDIEAGKKAYTELITEHPDSRYVPDALVNIGEYYFEHNAYKEALQLYDKAEQYKNNPARAFAVYKQAWCFYNLGDYQRSLTKMLKVLTIARQQHKAGVRGTIDLMEEARSELIFPYAKVGKPGAAIKFFKRYAEQAYLDLTFKLAGLFSEQTEYVKSTKLLRSLIKEARANKVDGRDMSFMVIRVQRQIVENAHRSVDKKSTVEEVQALTRYFEELSEVAPLDFITKEKRRIDRLILDVATGYHTEYKSTKDLKTLEHTQVLYDEYLRIFKNAPNAYAIGYNNALLMMMTGKYRRAAETFEAVITQRPNGKYADDAAERAVVAYLKNLQVDNKDVKNEAEEDLKARELTADEERFVRAVDRWMAIIERRGVNPETKDNIAPARFAAAKILYNANRFQNAAKRFVEVTQKHSDHSFWETAARHVLSAYNLDHDVDNLRRYANRFEKNAKLMETSIAADVHRIRNEFNFQECFKFEKKKAYRSAAECFIQYSKEFASAEKAPAAIFNAGLNYFRAKRVEKALEMQKRLYEEYSNNELAPKALYSIGEILRETGVYDQAADVYELFTHTYQKHPLAEKALKYAATFRKTLGQYGLSIINLKAYLKRYPNPANSPRIHLQIILLKEKQGRKRGLVKAAKEHLKKYPDEDPSIRLQVLAVRGKAFWTLGSFKDASWAFEQTVSYFRELDDAAVAKLNMIAISAVAEAHFNLGNIQQTRATYVKMKGNSKAIQKAVHRKLELLTAAKSIYEQVIGYGHPGWNIAANSQLGLAYRDLADTVENTQVPSKLRRIPEAVEEFKTLMAEKAVPIRERALANFRRALEIARNNHWYNQYSEKAEIAIAELDMTDASVKEERLRPGLMQPLGGLPDFKHEVN